MLKDHVRTTTYRKAIEANASMFKGIHKERDERETPTQREREREREKKKILVKEEKEENRKR